MNILLICDICGKQFNSKWNININNLIENDDKKIICKSCKIKQGKIKKYGSLENAKKIIQENREKAMILKYGVKNPFQLKEVQEKIKKTLGVENCSQLESVKLKKKNRDKVKFKESIKKHWINPEQYDILKNEYNLENKLRIKDKYFYKNQLFDSSWELIYYIWLEDHDKNFEYHPKSTFLYKDLNGKEHRYFPDFLVEGEYYEIKGNQFFKNDEPIHSKYGSWKEKFDCMIKNNVKILKYEQISIYKLFIIKKYGKKYLSSLRLKNSPSKISWNSIKIQCVETGEIFNTIADAKRKYGGKIHQSLKTGKPTFGKYHYIKI